jgi:hypothetical protein
MSRRTDSTQSEPLYPLIWQMHTTPDRYGQRCRISDDGTAVEFADGACLRPEGFFRCSDLLWRLERGAERQTAP